MDYSLLWTLSILSNHGISTFRQHGRTHGQDGSYCFRYYQSMDVGCYAPSKFQRCVALRSVGTLLVRDWRATFGNELGRRVGSLDLAEFKIS
jgi:hypothetical protein